MRNSIRRMADDNKRYREANPFVLQNTQNSQSLCGRYPTLADAIMAAKQRGGVVEVSGNVVYFSELPLL